MELIFLGTGAGAPSRRRNVTAIALWLTRGDSTVWLFDCGEATQHRMFDAPFGPNRVDRVFITHLHGDHIFGLPGLLSTRSFPENVGPLHLYGPPGTQAFVRAAIDASHTHLSYEIQFHEWTSPKPVPAREGLYTVRAALLDHAIPSYGYRVEEAPFPGRLHAERLRAAGVAPSPLWARLKAGEDMTLPDGRRLRAADFVDPAEPGRVIAILGDTRPCEAAVELARGADCLVHEATFLDRHAHLASAFFHSTARQAAEIAREAEAKCLILTHVSARYERAEEDEILAEARAIFPNTLLAYDGMAHEIPRNKRDV
ncbi:ribonuclease Z [Alicyclobacillus mali]|uniref:Ribonuclease Z n=1 Tax=Alicyclobacillus mali (ex Roth et al. 2021) TaxID=1123961 RepID=A0ABS0F088_9BACL|nr:ribonuclease Z [Alicyclobacillus mali (ex Roth et al. 2021)]MBF8376723.1 ribonuclease Z [Alicyclobacillus mali (ex Roth et al. 2021)]MCL6488537.1 ribonuclease Z [Alicyclobacillus mali (ex Roth et al. 2021)]